MLWQLYHKNYIYKNNLINLELIGMVADISEIVEFLNVRKLWRIVPFLVSGFVYTLF